MKPKNPSEIVCFLIFAFLAFASVSIIVSYWAGFFFLSTPLILVISLPITFFLWKKFRPEAERIPLEVLLAALLVAGICAFPLLLATPYYMGSSDSFHTTTLRTLETAGKIPETYAPYSGVSFTYQIGLHLFAKIFADLLFFVQDYIVLWALGVLLAAIEAILVYLVSKELFKSEPAGKWAAILFIGTKTIYINMYFGMFHRMLGSCLILLFLYFFLKKNRLAFLLVPAMLMVHIAWTVNCAILMLVFAAFNRQRFTDLLKTVPFAFIALPAFLMDIKIYIAHFSKILGGASEAASPVQPLNMLQFTVSYLLSMGWAVGALFGLSLVYSLLKKRVDRNKLFAFSVFIAGSFMHYFAALSGLTIENELPWLFTLGGIFFISLVFSEIKLEKRHLNYLKILVVALLLLGFSTSSYVTTRIWGTKISPPEASFALKFKDFDPELKTAVFLGIPSAKTAELSNKVPYNAGEGWFLPFDERLVVHDQAYYRELEKIKTQEKIMETKCASCVLDLNADYAVIDIEKFPALPGKSPVLEQGSLKLYKIR
ncbi:MAG: hypothetical protein NT067_03000 [Candidatus Diapherotrites archaeon]|nr:hypothetical protein [Candidatus Diapherotrites archaeon]